MLVRRLLLEPLRLFGDVLIAFVGGIAGIIGARKKETNNIVPGVAIATALMPPLCTVGYAIASANLKFIIRLLLPIPHQL